MHSSTGGSHVAYWQKALASSLTIFSLVVMTAGPLLTPSIAFADTEHHQSYHDGHAHDGDVSHHGGDDNDQGDDQDNDDTDGHGGHVKGSITVCKILVDASGAPINGATLPATTFTVAGVALPHHTLPTTVFTAPLALTQHFLDSSEGDDAACKSYTKLKLGSYHYGAETITSSADFEAPLYNDQFTTAVHSTSDFFALNNEDANVDGTITLTKSRPNRTLVVLNKLKAPACDATEVAHTEYSDAGTEDTTDSHAAVVLTTIHPNWVQALSEAAAKWIWSDNPVTNPGSNDTKVFTKTFTVVGTPSAASIDIAADNHYVLKVNGVEVANPAEPEHNYEASVHYPITLESGVNTIEVTVNNIGIEGNTADQNPAGLIFQVHYTANECVTPPTFLKVHIFKYLKDGDAVSQVANDSGAPAFPMTATWSATNIGSGSGSYVLGNSHGGAAFVYAADTSAMSAPADYTTSEVTDGSVVLPADSACVAGKYRLVGYKSGDSLSAAESASVTASVPAFTGLTADKYVIVVNEQCATPAPACDAQVNLVQNPSFEAPTVIDNGGTWQLYPTGTALLEWAVRAVTGENTPSLEIQRHYSGWLASAGEQFAELDSTESTSIYQDVTTVPGYTYKVGFDFAARPDASTLADNAANVLFGGAALASVSSDTIGDNATVWQHHEYTVVATSTATRLEFTDTGTSNSFGSFVDNVSVACQPPVVVVDVCTNVDGIQTEIPAGYHATGENTCAVNVVTDNTPTPPSGGGGGGNPSFASFGGGGGGGAFFTQGQVAGASCGLYMDKHLKFGSNKNDKEQVKKLQQLLNKYGFGPIPVTGFFGPATLAAVKAFQNKYGDDVLKPWGLNTPTGLVYLSTLLKINLLECPDLTLQLPPLVPWSANPHAQ